MSAEEAGGMSADVQLPADRRSACSARRFLQGHLTAWDLSDAVSEIATLLVSELVGNAVRHARGPVTVTVSLQPAQLRVVVHDDSSVVPSRRVVTVEDEDGRGLWLVESLATRWGADRYPDDGKDVWFELDADPPPRAVSLREA